jgi:hypothetical protein
LYYLDFYQKQRPGSQLSGAKNRLILSQLDQFYVFFCSKNPFRLKNFATVKSALLKKINFVANNFRMDRDISKIQTDFNSANQMLSLDVKFMFIESNALLKYPKLKTPNISVTSQNFKK